MHDNSVLGFLSAPPFTPARCKRRAACVDHILMLLPLLVLLLTILTIRIIIIVIIIIIMIIIIITTVTIVTKTISIITSIIINNIDLNSLQWRGGGIAAGS